MDFNTASDRLTECITLSDIAKEANVSDATIRRARLKKDTKAYRNPPAIWRRVIARLARRRAKELERLAKELQDR